MSPVSSTSGHEPLWFSIVSQVTGHSAQILPISASLCAFRDAIAMRSGNGMERQAPSTSCWILVSSAMPEDANSKSASR